MHKRLCSAVGLNKQEDDGERALESTSFWTFSWRSMIELRVCGTNKARYSTSVLLLLSACGCQAENVTAMCRVGPCRQSSEYLVIYSVYWWSFLKITLLNPFLLVCIFRPPERRRRVMKRQTATKLHCFIVKPFLCKQPLKLKI